MNAEANEGIVRRFVEAANARDYDALEDLLDPGFRRHCPATPEVRVESAKDFLRFLAHEEGVFPDNRTTLEAVAAGDAQVGFWASFRGTQAGAMGPFPASGRAVDVEFAGMFTIADGRITRLRVTWDNVSVLNQLGHLAEPPQAPG